MRWGKKGLIYILVFSFVWGPNSILKAQENTPVSPLETTYSPRFRLYQTFQKYTESLQLLSAEAKTDVEKLTELSEKLFDLKELTEQILNAPIIDGDALSIEDHVAEFQDQLSSYFKTHVYMPFFRRHFITENFKTSESMGVNRRQIVFVRYQKLLEAYKRAYMAHHVQALEKSPEVWRPMHLILNENGMHYFRQFALEEPFFDLRMGEGTYEIIPSLMHDLDLEMESFTQVQTKAGWKKILKHMALNLWVQKWIGLDEVWRGDGASILPKACKNQFYAFHELIVPRAIQERKLSLERMLFRTQLVVMMMLNPDMIIPNLIDQDFVQKIIELTPFWKEAFQSIQENHTPEEVENATQGFFEAHLKFETVHRHVEGETARWDALQWFLYQQNENPFDWPNSENAVREKVSALLQKFNLVLLLSVIEKVNFPIEQVQLSPVQKKQMIAYVETYVQSKKELFEPAVEALTQAILKSKESALEAASELSEARRTQNQIAQLEEVILKTVEAIGTQDQNIETLKSGKSLPLISDTPQNFSIVSTMFEAEVNAVLGKEPHPQTLEIIQKLFFKDPKFDEAQWQVEDGTFRAAQYKYREWKKTESQNVSDEIKNEVDQIVQVLKVDRILPLQFLVETPVKRLEFEKRVRQNFMGHAPILNMPVNAFGKEDALYIQIQKLQKKNQTNEAADLIQQAIWRLKTVAKSEVERFCSLDPETLPGLKHLFTNTSFRTQSLGHLKDEDVHESFEAVNDAVIEELEVALDHSRFEKTIGTGFMLMIAIHFLAGPLSSYGRMPWFLGGRYIPRVGAGIRFVADWFGLMMSVPAMYWIARDYKRYFWNEYSYIEAFENYQKVATYSTSGPVTLGDMIAFRQGVGDKETSDRKVQGRPVKFLFQSRTQLFLTHQAGLIVMAPVFFSFFRNMFRYGQYQLLSTEFEWAQKARTAQAVSRLNIPNQENMFARRITFWKNFFARYGSYQKGIPKDVTVFHPKWIQKATIQHLDEALEKWALNVRPFLGNLVRGKVTRPMRTQNPVEVLEKYMARYLKILQRDLARHEAQYGKTLPLWVETAESLEANVARLKIPKHVNENLYLGSLRRVRPEAEGEKAKWVFEKLTPESLGKIVTEDRQALLSKIRIFEDVLVALKKSKATKLSEVPFHESMPQTIQALKNMFGPEFTVFKNGKLFENVDDLLNETQLLAFVIRNIETHRFQSLWWGQWVGYGGPLGRAMAKFDAYYVLMTLSHDSVLSKVAGLSDVAHYTARYRMAQNRLLQEKMEKGEPGRASDLSERDVQFKMFEIEQSFFLDIKMRAINLAIERRMDAGLDHKVEAITKEDVQQALMDIVLKGVQPKNPDPHLHDYGPKGQTDEFLRLVFPQ